MLLAINRDMQSLFESSRHLGHGAQARGPGQRCSPAPVEVAGGTARAPTHERDTGALAGLDPPFSPPPGPPGPNKLVITQFGPK